MRWRRRRRPSRTSFVPHQTRHGAHTDSLCPTEFDIALVKIFPAELMVAVDRLFGPDAIPMPGLSPPQRARSAGGARPSMTINFPIDRLASISGRGHRPSAGLPGISGPRLYQRWWR